MPAKSLRDSHRKDEWTQSHWSIENCCCFSLPLPRNKGHLLGEEAIQELRPISSAPPRHNRAHWKVSRMLVWFLITELGRSASWPPSSDWHNLLHTEGVSTVSETTNDVTLGELEERGIWWKGTCKSEILLGENTVHALRQSSGIGGRAGHGRAQNELPAGRGWEVWCQVLPPLFRGAHSLQFLLRWSHGCSLEEKQMLNSTASQLGSFWRTDESAWKYIKMFYITQLGSQLCYDSSNITTQKMREAWNIAWSARDYKQIGDRDRG